MKKSNITDNESAKMPTSKGVIQGYDGLELVDAKHQIVIEAQAHGEGQEHGLLIAVLEVAREHFAERGRSRDVLRGSTVLADAGFCSERNAKYLAENNIEGYIADSMFLKRDPRFKTATRHKPTREWEPHSKPKKKDLLFQPQDFQLAKDHSHCICPRGKRMYCSGRPQDLKGCKAVRFRAPLSACRECSLRARCIRHPGRTVVRQVAFFLGRAANKPETYCARMKRRIDSEQGRYAYSRRLGIVEPVFANIRSTRRLGQFTLRGRHKVNTQWMLYCLVHNIGKLQRYGTIDSRPMSSTRKAA